MSASPPQAPVPSAAHYRPANASAPLSPQPLAWDILQMHMHPFLQILLISEDSSSWVVVGGDRILNWGFCFVLQVVVCPATTTSHVPAPAAGEVLTAASPLIQPLPCTTGYQLITHNSAVTQHQNTITSIQNKFRFTGYIKVLFGLSSHSRPWSTSEGRNSSIQTKNYRNHNNYNMNLKVEALVWVLNMLQGSWNDLLQWVYTIRVTECEHTLLFHRLIISPACSASLVIFSSAGGWEGASLRATWLRTVAVFSSRWVSGWPKSPVWGIKGEMGDASGSNRSNNTNERENCVQRYQHQFAGGVQTMVSWGQMFYYMYTTNTHRHSKYHSLCSKVLFRFLCIS